MKTTPQARLSLYPLNLGVIRLLAALCVLTGVASAQTFQINTLTASNAVVVDVNGIAGDDRGGIAVSGSQVFYSGDAASVRASRNGLTGVTTLGVVREGLVTDLRTETVYLLANGTTPITPHSSSAMITTLLALDGLTGATNGTVITLSSSISVPTASNNGSVGVFAGWGRIVIHNGTRVYSIAIPTGVVTDLGAQTVPTRTGSETWAYWGVAELIGGETYLAYVQDSTKVVRRRVSNGAVTTIATFSNLGDMASFTVVPALNRWYFHNESGGQFGSVAELLGYADATFTLPTEAPTISSQPAGLLIVNTEAAAFSVSAIGTDPLRYQWRKDGVAIANATNTTFALPSALVSDSGGYTVVITNNYGAVTSSVAVLTVEPITTDLLKITSLRTNNFFVVDPLNFAGDDRGGLVVTDQKIFLRGDDSVGSFNVTNLGSGIRLGTNNGANTNFFFYDSMIGDLRSRKVYLLANGSTAIGVHGGTATTLIEIHGSNGVPVGSPISLSAGIGLPDGQNAGGQYSGKVGLFSGWGRLVVHNGTNAFSIDPTTGTVTDFGAMTTPVRSLPQPAESWAYWGVAEYYGGTVKLVYGRDATSIVRSTVPSGTVEVIGTFSNVHDLANLTVVPTMNRWYFHNESVNQFTNYGNYGAEVLGYADATFLFQSQTAITFAANPVTVLEDSGASATSSFVTLVPGGTASYVVTNDSNALFSVQPAISAVGTLTFTPAANANGTAVLGVTALNSSSVQVGTGTFTITVTPVNDAPTVTLAAGSVTVSEDSGAQAVAAFATTSAGPANEAGQSVTLTTVTNNNNALFSAQPAISAAGVLTFTAAANAYGSATVTVIAQDNGGTLNGGADTSAPQFFTITVTPVNDAPSVGFASNVVVLEDSGTASLTGFASFTTGPANESGQTLVGYAVANNNSGLFSSPPAINTSGVLTFTPAANANGVATVTVIAQDDGGTANGGVDLTTNTFTITVTAVNDAPSFALGFYTGLITNSFVTAWGAEDHGASTVPPILTDVTAVASGTFHSLALKRDGTVVAWGDAPMSTVPGGLSGVTAIASGWNHSLALKNDGTVIAWGGNSEGQSTVPPGLDNVVAIAGGFNVSMAAKSDGTVVAWGQADFGQLTIPGGLANVIAVAAGYHSVALKGDGTVVVWGGADEGELNMPPDLSGVTAIAAGNNHTVALKSDGTVVAWGNNSQGQTNVPAGLTNVIAIAAGSHHSLALKSDGTVVAWGRNNAGQSDVPVGLVNVTGIAGGVGQGQGHSLAIVSTFSTNGIVVNEDSGAFTLALAATNIVAGPADESGQVVSFVVTNDNNALFTSQPAVSTAGTLTFTPAANAFGSATITVIAQDNGGTANGGVDTSAAQTFTITVNAVNDAPSVTYVTNNVLVLEDSGAFSSGAGFAAFSPGPANESAQTLVGYTVANSNEGLFTVQPALAADGTLTFTVATATNGSATVTVIAQDSGGTANGGVDKSTNTFTITVAGVNHAPSFALASATVTVLEDAGAQSVPGFGTSILAGPANEAAQVVSFTVTNDANALFLVQPALNGAGTLTFTPAVNAYGSATVTVIAHDDGGTANGGVDTSAAQTFTLTVTSVNDAPVIGFASNVVVLEDSGAASLAGFAAITTGPANESGQMFLGLTVANDNPSLFSVAPALSGGTLTFTPAANAYGSATVTVIAQDDGGTANGGVDKATNTFLVTVTAVNDAPLITFASNVVVQQDSSAASLGTFAAITTGPANESGQSITNLAVSNDNTALFSAQPSLMGGTLTFTPALNAIGTATVTVIAQDNGGTDNGGVNVATNTFTISVIGVNHAPTFTLRPVNTQSSLLNNGSFETGSFSGWIATDTANTSPTLAVRANGTNLGFFNVSSSDGTYSATHGFSGANAGSISLAQDVTLPPGGGAALSFTYRAAWQTFSAAGDRVFRFAVQPAGGGADLYSQTVLTVAPNAFGFQTTNTPVTVDLSAFAGQTVRVVFVTDIAAGDAGNGSFQLDNVQLSATTPDFTVYESTGASTTLNFATNILAGPPSELAQTVTFTVTNNNNALFSSQPAIAVDGTLTFALAFNSNGVATVTVYAHDNGGTANGGVDTSVAHTFTITVLPINSAPQISFNTANLVVNEDRGPYSAALATFSRGPADEAGQSITNVVTANNNSGLFSVQPSVSTSGVLTFTPAANSNGVATVTVIAQDNGGTANGGVNLATNSFTLTVTAVNDAPSFALPAGPPVAAGAVWTAQASGSQQWSRVVASADGTKLAAIYWGGLIHTSTDSGATWTPQVNSGSRNWIGLASSADGTKLAAAVNGGGIYTSADSGATWTLQAGAGTRGWGNLGMSPDGSRLMASGYFIPAYGSTDGGVTWTQVQTSRQWGPITIATDGLKVSMVETGGPIWTSLNFGTNWFTGTGTAGNLNPLAASADGTKLVTASAQGGTIYTSTNTGTNWTSRESQRTWIALASSADGSFLVAAVQNGLIYTSSDSGVTWTPQPGSGSRNWSSLAMSADGSKMFATDGSGFIYSSGAGFGPYVVTVLEDSGAYTGGANFATSISPGPADESTQVVDFLVSNNNNALFSAQPALAADGTLTYTLAANAFGSAVVTVRAHDNGGTDNGGVDTSAAQTFTLNVTNVNDAPSITLGTTTVTVNEDSGAYSGALATFAKGPANESGQSITNVTVTGNSNPGLFSVAPAVSTSGVLTFTPALNANGSATVTITAQDNGGTANGGVDLSAPVSFTITVGPVNDAPGFAIPGGTPVGQSLLAWGRNTKGQLGDATLTDRHSPVQIGTSTEWQSLSAGFEHTVAVKTDGTLWAWGNNDSGQLGDGTTTQRSSPVQIGTGTDWRRVAAGYAHTLAIKADGTLWTWGWNAFGQLGTGSYADSLIPVQVGTATDWQSVTASYYFTVALKVNGTLWAWGENGAGQLGDSNAQRNSPTQVGTATDWQSMSLGSGYTMAVKTDGTLWAWGGNDWGQLGDGTTTTRRTPVQIGTATNWRSVSAGDSSTLAVKTDGTLWGWGWNGYGQLGNGSSSPSSIPVQSGTATDWLDVDAGGTHVLAVKTDGTLWASGDNSRGQLGDGTTSNRATPVRVGSVVNGQLVRAGYYHSVALSGLAIAGPHTLTVAEDSGAYIGSGFATSILVGPADEAAQAVDFLVSNDNNALFSSQPAIAADGTLTFTPAANAFGTATVTVRAHDDGGTANGGVDTSAAQTFTITVTAVNDAPTVAFNTNNVVALEDSGANSVSGFASVTSYGAGETGQTLVGHVVTAANTALFSVQPVINTSGVLTFTPATNANGSTTVTVVSQDSGGTANGGVDQTTNTFTITVVSVNDAPSFGIPVGVAAAPGGDTWTAQTGSGTDYWQSIASSADGTKLAVVSGLGKIHTSTDSGVTWTARLTDANRNWRSIASSTDGTKLAAVNYNGQIYTSTDSGATWTARETIRYWWAIASSADGTKLVAANFNAGSGGYLYTSTDSGATWTERLNDFGRPWRGVASSADGTKLVAVAENSQVYTSTDSGVTWTARDSSRNWQGVASSADGTKLVAFVSAGQLYISTDSGVTWTARDSNRNWTSVASSSDGSRLLASVNNGNLYTSADSGATWTARDSTRTWQCVASSADGSKLAAGVYNGSIYTSAGAGVGGGGGAVGETWTPRDSVRLWARVASSADGTKLLAATWGLGRLYTSTDSGVTWTERASERAWYQVASSADGTKLVASPGGGPQDYVYTSTDSGVTWTPRLTDATRSWTGLASSADGTKLVAVAGGSQIFTSTDSGETWTARDSARSWTSVASSADGTKLAAAVGGGLIYTSTDSGVTWAAQPGSGSHGWYYLASSADGTKLIAADFTFSSGYIYTSADSGVTWTARLTDAGRPWRTVASSADGNTLLAAGIDTQLYVSTDAGATWTARDSVRGLWDGLAISADGSKLVAAAYNDRIYTSTGGGGGGGSAAYVLSVLEDSGAYTGGANFATSISAGPADESAQVVDFLVSNDNNALFSSQPAIAADGTLTFTPALNAFGSATVTVRAHDDGGTANGGVDTSAAQTFTITVTAVNDAPSFTLAGTNQAAFTADGAVTQANWLTNLLAGPANESGQTVTLTVTNSDNAQFTVQPAIAADGTLTFTPVLGASGIVTVGVIAQDNGGTANGGVDTSVVHYFTISFANVKVFVSDSPTVAAGDSVSVPVSLAGLGVEGGVGFTLTFDPTLLSFNSVSTPAGLSLLAQASQAGSGRVGIAVSKPVGSTFAAGTNLVITVSFTTAAITTNAVTPVGYSDAIAVQQVADGSAGILAPVLWVPGQVTITAGTAGTGTLEGDVSPRPGGNGNVTVADAIQIGRYAAGLDTITSFGPNSEFQRADCAPLGTKGDGVVTVADWVQALRFAAGMDTPGLAGGPTGDGPLLLGLRANSLKLPAGSRTVRVAGGALVAGRENTVTVQMDAQGNEAGVQFSLEFDPSVLTFVRATLGSGAAGASFMPNLGKVAAGKLGLVLVMPAGSSIAAGMQDIITLTFNVTGSGSTAITVATNSQNTPREVADVAANVLGVNYVDGTFNIVLPVGLKAAGMERATDGSLRLVVRNSDGTAVTAVQAAKYQVHVTANLGGAWTLLPNALVVENGALKIVDPAASGAGLRLYKLVETP